MRRVRKKAAVHQRSSAADVRPTAAAVDDRSVAVALIQALIPLGLRAVEDALPQEVVALAGARYAHADGHGGIARWGSQAGSIFLLDQKIPITVPRVRDVRAGTEVALTTYAQLQTPRTQDVGLFRRVLGGLSCREYEGAAEAVPEAFGLAKSSVSRRFIRASATALQALHERRHDDAEWLVLCKRPELPCHRWSGGGRMLSGVVLLESWRVERHRSAVLTTADSRRRRVRASDRAGGPSPGRVRGVCGARR